MRIWECVFLCVSEPRPRIIVVVVFRYTLLINLWIYLLISLLISLLITM
jgi:hypothetical protein